MRAICLLSFMTVSFTIILVKGIVSEELKIIEFNKATLRELSDSEKWSLSLYNESIELGLTYKQFRSLKSILVNLRRCESMNDDTAVNEKDLDGTASYGRYQFKPDTFYDWGMGYGLLPTNLERSEAGNLIMDGDLQENILMRAVIDNGRSKRWWLQQFPWCSLKYKFWETWSKRSKIKKQEYKIMPDQEQGVVASDGSVNEAEVAEEAQENVVADKAEEASEAPEEAPEAPAESAQ